MNINWEENPEEYRKVIDLRREQEYIRMFKNPHSPDNQKRLQEIAIELAKYGIFD